MNPRKSGIITALFWIIISGVGALVAVVFIGFAAIPTGFVIGITNILDGMRTFLMQFIESFFQPFIVLSGCAAGGQCSTTIAGTAKANVLVQSAGLLGFGAAIILVGILMYIVAAGVSSYV